MFYNALFGYSAQIDRTQYATHAASAKPGEKHTSLTSVTFPPTTHVPAPEWALIKWKQALQDNQSLQKSHHLLNTWITLIFGSAFILAWFTLLFILLKMSLNYLNPRKNLNYGQKVTTLPSKTLEQTMVCMLQKLSNPTAWNTSSTWPFVLLVLTGRTASPNASWVPLQKEHTTNSFTLWLNYLAWYPNTCGSLPFITP